MPIWDNHFSPHTQAHSLGYTLHSSLFTFHSFTPSRVNIGRFANRPYDRTQKPSYQYGIITLHFSPHTQAHSLGYTLHSSLFTFHSPTCQHRAICKSPLQQNAKALMLIWDNHSSLFTPPTLRLLRLKKSRRGRGGLFW